MTHTRRERERERERERDRASLRSSYTSVVMQVVHFQVWWRAFESGQLRSTQWINVFPIKSQILVIFLKEINFWRIHQRNFICSVNTKDRSERPCRTEADLDLMVVVGGWWWSWWMVLQATARLLERLHAEEAAKMEALARRRSFAKNRSSLNRSDESHWSGDFENASECNWGRVWGCDQWMLLSWITKRYG